MAGVTGRELDYDEEKRGQDREAKDLAWWGA